MTKATCSRDGCDKPVRARKMCGAHYVQWSEALKRAGKPLPPLEPKRRAAPKLCSVKTCEGIAEKRGWCAAHYSRWRRDGDLAVDVPVAVQPERLPPHASDATCMVDACPKPARGGGRGWCAGHYERWRLTGDVRADVPLRELAVYGPDSRCAVDDCDDRPSIRGWCRMHWERWYHSGDPLHERTVIVGDKVTFEESVDRSGGPDACHPWTGRQNADGYGMAKVGDEWKGAHVAAWAFENGTPPPKGFHLDHECHNQAIRDGLCKPGKCEHRLCCNLRHIVPRTNSEHHRATPGRELRRKNGHRKLTENQVRELRRLLEDAQGEQVAEIGRQYGIGRTQAYRIKRGTAWKWLPDAA